MGAFNLCTLVYSTSCIDIMEIIFALVVQLTRYLPQLLQHLSQVHHSFLPLLLLRLGWSAAASEDAKDNQYLDIVNKSGGHLFENLTDLQLKIVCPIRLLDDNYCSNFLLPCGVTIPRWFFSSMPSYLVFDLSYSTVVLYSKDHGGFGFLSKNITPKPASYLLYKQYWLGTAKLKRCLQINPNELS